ncbi:MAG: ATP F0F1 synthase subunit B, partial [Cucumibacter sp.]
RADLADKRAGVEAGLAAKMATAEGRIQETKIAALSHVEEIATDTATTLVSLLLGRVPAKSIKDAVKQMAKGR